MKRCSSMFTLLAVLAVPSTIAAQEDPTCGKCIDALLPPPAGDSHKFDPREQPRL